MLILPAASGGIRDYFLEGKRIRGSAGNSVAEADFLSTASVIPQSLPVRELVPHSELCPGLTERGRDIAKHKRERMKKSKRGRQC